MNPLIVCDPKKPGEFLRIKDSNKFRVLVTNLEQNQSWKKHLVSGKKAVLPSIRQQLGALKLLGSQIPQKTRKLLAEGLMLRKFNYLISLWGGATPNFITAAQRTQNKIARWVTSRNKRTRISTLLETCGWLSIQESEKIPLFDPTMENFKT